MKKAFTLIELLVVIAIIAILAAMLMPALERARRMAKQSTCASNVHNIGLAINMYRSDHQQKWIAGNSSWFSYGWCELQAFLMHDYLSDFDVMMCPSLNTAVTRTPGLTRTGNVDNCVEPPLAGGAAKTWAHVEDVAYFYDERDIPDNPDPARVIDGDGTAMFNWHGPEPANHNDGANVLYVDNAVEWVGITRADDRWEMSLAQVTYPGGWWSNPLPTVGPWVRYGYIQNPRLNEDGLDDLDDIYYREGTSRQWGQPNPDVADTWWGQSSNARNALDWGCTPGDKVDCALGGGDICPDWWGGTWAKFRGPYPAAVGGNQYVGWQWGVTPEFEGIVFE